MSLRDELKSIKEEPYIGVLLFCGISVVIIFISEYHQQIWSIIGSLAAAGGIWFWTTMLPIGGAVLIYKLIKRAFRN